MTKDKKDLVENILGWKKYWKKRKECCIGYWLDNYIILVLIARACNGSPLGRGDGVGGDIDVVG